MTFDCVASSQSIDDGLRFTKSAGTLVLVGMPGIPTHVDWTPLWFKELTIHAAYAYGPEPLASACANSRVLKYAAQDDTFTIALDLMRSWGSKLTRLVGPPFCLADHRAALASAINTGQSGVAKTVFAVNNGQK